MAIVAVEQFYGFAYELADRDDVLRHDQSGAEDEVPRQSVLESVWVACAAVPWSVLACWAAVSRKRGKRRPRVSAQSVQGQGRDRDGHEGNRDGRLVAMRMQVRAFVCNRWGGREKCGKNQEPSHVSMSLFRLRRKSRMSNVVFSSIET